MAGTDVPARAARFGLSSRLLIVLLVTILIGAAVGIAMVTRETRRTTAQLAMQYGLAAAEQQVREIARRIDAMGITMNAAAIATELQVDRDLGDRRAVIGMLRGLLERTPDALGLWVILEPDVFPIPDAQVAGRYDLGANSTGRFAPFLIRRAGQILEDQPVEDVASDWYVLPQLRGRETVLDPYHYDVAGSSVLMTSLAVPLTAGGRFIGIAGIDFAIDDLSRLLAEIRPLGGTIGLVDSRGVWIASPDADRLGARMTAAPPPGPEPLHMEVTVSPEGQEVHRLVVPFEVHETGTLWAIVCDIPKEALEAPARLLRNELIVVNVVLALASMLVIGIAIAHFVGRPLSGVVGSIRRIAAGDIRHPVEGTGRGDEFGGINRALDAYRRALESDRARRQQMQRILSALDLADEGIVVTDPATRILYANTAALRIIVGAAGGSVDPAALVGHSWAEIAQGAGYAALAIATLGRETAALAPGGEWAASLICPVGEGGAERVMRVRARRLPAERGIVLIGAEVTADRAIELERRAIEARLRRAQRMEAVGQLTGGIAHDFNNLLMVILGNAEMLSAMPDLPPEGRETARLVLAAGDRAAELVDQLLAFSRQQPLRPVALDLTEQVERLMPLLKRTLGDGIAVELDCAQRPLVAEVDGTQLDSAIINLCVNARDAMPKGGRLQITLRPVSLGPADLARDMVGAPPPVPGPYVEIAAVDEGEGVPAAALAHVFEPFFTTKEIGAGSGLGLSMVYGFATQSGGGVTLESVPGEGTTVRIWLPRAG